MRVRDIVRGKGREVHVIDVEADLHAAIRMLNEHRIGALVVTDGTGGIAGILSERDILRECGARCDRARPGESLELVGPARVRDVMTAEVITATFDDDLTAVMNVMTTSRIRHLPIVEDGALVAIISIGDAVKACVAEAEDEARTLKDYIQSGGY